MEKGKVQNPLTIIAIFAGIAEVAGTIVLLGLPLEIQKIFVWFVIGFPSVLIVTFFLVLIFRPDALYAPGDYKNEQLFVDLLMSRKKAVDSTINEATELLKEVKSVVKEEDKNAVSLGKLDEISSKIERAKQSNDELINQLDGFIFIRNELNQTQRKILSLLKKSKSGLSADELSDTLLRSPETIYRYLLFLESKNLVKTDEDNSNKFLSRFYIK